MPKQNQDGLRLKSLVIENFKNLAKWSFDFEGGSYFIIGKNGAGKSAILQAISSPLNAVSRPLEAIKQGETHGSIKMELEGTIEGLPSGYKIDVYFDPTNSQGRLVVKNHNGEVIKSPASTLKSILNSIALDPLEFSRLPTSSKDANKRTKVSVLKELTGVDFTELDMKKFKLNTDKIILVSSIRGKENDLATHGMSQEDMLKYEKPIDENPIKKDFDELSGKITAWSDANGRVDKYQENVDAIESAIIVKNGGIENFEEQIRSLTERIRQEKLSIEQLGKDRAEAKTKLAAGRKWQEANPNPPSSQEISRRLEEAREHNKHHDKVQALIAKHGEVRIAKQEKEALDIKLNEIEVERKSIISKSNIPIKGLEFDSETVTINGVPFEENDLNTAQRIEYGIEIAMALNPSLKIIMIQDGSLLDNETTAKIFQSCTDKGYQLLIERVRPEGGETELKFIEEELK